jgi:pyrroloquinoline quinone biosynthesis protein D
VNHERPLAIPSSKPRFPRHVRMQFDEVRKRLVVLAPERIYWPDEVAADILKLCDGNRTIAEIAAQLAKDYAAPAETIQTDVLEFVQEWADLLLLSLGTP